MRGALHLLHAGERKRQVGLLLLLTLLLLPLAAPQVLHLLAQAACTCSQDLQLLPLQPHRLHHPPSPLCAPACAAVSPHSVEKHLNMVPLAQTCLPCVRDLPQPQQPPAVLSCPQNVCHREIQVSQVTHLPPGPPPRCVHPSQDQPIRWPRNPPPNDMVVRR